jgi:spore maturation protein CgeB
MTKGKILFVCNSPTTLQLGMRIGLQSLGWKLEIFCWDDYIQESRWKRVQNKYLWGQVIREINEALIEKSNSLKPDVVLIWEGICIWPQTIDKMKHCTRLVTSYYADNPFGNYNRDYAKRYKIKGNILLSKIVVYEKGFFFRRHVANFIKAISSYDIHFVPRVENIDEYKRAGAREVYLLYRYYTPEFHHPMKLTEDDRKRLGSNVIFIGHFEPDHRTECLEALLDTGINVRLFGTGWNRYLSKKLEKALGRSIKPLYGDEYVKAICASKMALCFISKLNTDTSTTRCFEVPACGALLLSERTNELKDELYEEGKEAVYFSDKVELVERVKMLLSHPEKRKAIAMAGHKRCLSSGYDVVSRMRVWDDAVCKKLNIT